MSTFSKVLFAILVVFGIMALAVMAQDKPVKTPENIELTKTESMELVNLQYQIVLLQADLRDSTAKRDALVKGLVSKYKVNLEDYNLDAATGRFVVKEKKDNEKKSP